MLERVIKLRDREEKDSQKYVELQAWVDAINAALGLAVAVKQKRQRKK